jgi:single-stranded DNA-binding protein
MSVAVLVTGSLFRAPEQKTSQSGKRYVVATIKAGAAENTSSEFWSALAFGDTAGAELLRLAVGERLAVQGRLKLETFEKNGETKISRSVFVDSVLALRQPAKERKPKTPAPGSKAGDAIAMQSIVPSTDPALDDEIPF